jgi:peroxiredoxin
MKQNTALFSLGMLLSAVSIVLTTLGYNIVAGILAGVASIVLYPNLLRGTILQYGLAFWSYAAIGYALESHVVVNSLAAGTFQVESVLSLYLSGALQLLYLVVYLRLMLYKRLNRTSIIWLEPVLVSVAVVLYVLANLLNYHDWQHWVLMLPYALLGIHAGFIMFTDRILLKKNASKGYGAEIGKPVPNFELISETGETIKLSDYLGKRNVLVFFYRGDWCPFCNMMLRTYAKSSEKFREKDVILLAVGPDDPATNRALVENLHLDFHVLSDKDLAVVRQYGIRIDKYNASGNAKKYGQDSPLPASFLIDTKGILRYTSHPSRVGEFLSPETIFPVLAQLR